MERKNIGREEGYLIILFLDYYTSFSCFALHCTTSSKGEVCGVCREETEESKEQLKRERMRAH